MPVAVNPLNSSLNTTMTCNNQHWQPIRVKYSTVVHLPDGPNDVLIVEPDKGPVGEEMFTLPGSTTELQCVTDCFPACSITWFYHGKLLSTNSTIVFMPITPPYETPLSCVASNSATEENRTAETTVVVAGKLKPGDEKNVVLHVGDVFTQPNEQTNCWSLAEGPTNALISGPQTLETGVTASFTCSAECTPPPCSFTWTLYGKNMTGSEIYITVNRIVSEESISCQAENTFTGQTATVVQTLRVSGKAVCWSVDSTDVSV